ncbi:MAG: response regulator [bacterium]|nr:response regulator [bacterium]
MSDTELPKGHILLVDDSTGLLAALSEFLSEEGYEVGAAENPQKALDLAEEKVFDLVVTDIRMPNMSGIELVGRLKMANPEIEAILITGFGSKESILDALRLGVYDYIEKPFDITELLKSIVNCMEAVQLRLRVDHLVQNLDKNRRDLEQTIADQASEFGQRMQCFEQIEEIARRIEDAVDSIQRSNERIRINLASCKKQRHIYTSEVAQLVATGSRETKSIARQVSNLEAIAGDVTDSVRAKHTPPKTSYREKTPPPQSAPLPTTPTPGVRVEDPKKEAVVDGLYTEMQDFVESLVADADAGTPARIETAQQLIERVLHLGDGIESLYRKAMYHAQEIGDWDLQSAVVTHSVNVAIYSMKLGLGLDAEPEKLARLGIAGLVHDVGMAFLTPDLYTKDRFEKNDLKQLQEHPLKGAEYLLEKGEDWRWLAEIVLQEHEREDGSGYPYGLQRNQIQKEAKIIGIVDTYEGITRTRPGRRNLQPPEAVREITQTNRKKFERSILRALLHELSAFPIGTVVKLNSGAIVRVQETDPVYPLRPIVQVLFDTEGRLVRGEKRIALRDKPILHITSVVLDNELPGNPR